MDTISNKQAHRYVSKWENFDGHNMRGRRRTIRGFDAYTVYSWHTPILAFVDTGEGVQLWQNVNIYGSYTARHESNTRLYLMDFVSRHGFGHDILGRERGAELNIDLARRVERRNADLAVQAA